MLAIVGLCLLPNLAPGAEAHTPGTPEGAHPPLPVSERPYRSVAALLKGTCFPCHKPNDPLPKKRLFDWDGTLRMPRKAAVLNALEGNLSAPMRKVMKEQIVKNLHHDEKVLFQRWLLNNGRGKMLSVNQAAPAETDAALNEKFGAIPPENESQVAKDLKAELEVLTPAALADRLKDVVTLYVGDKENSGHTEKIKGAGEIGSFLPARLEESLKKLGALEADNPTIKQKQVVLYCGCCPLQYCEYAWRAAWYLRRRGYQNVKLVEFKHGFEGEWKDEGRPVEKF